MATGGGDYFTLSAKAAGDLSANQYQFVRWSDADTVNISSHDAAEDWVGVLQNKPNAAGRSATVQYAGETKIMASGNLTVNDLITTNGSGRATAATSGDMVMGRVLETAGADGDIVRMLILPFFTGNLS